MRCIAFHCASRLCYNRCVGVSVCIDCLSFDLATGTLTLLLAFFSASRLCGGFPLAKVMTEGIYCLLFYLAAGARSAFLAVRSAGWLGSYSPITPLVNVRLGLIVTLISFLVGGSAICRFRFIGVVRGFCGGRGLCRLASFQIARCK